MSITITWTQYAGQKADKYQSITLHNGGTLGRAADNHFVVYDPEHYCSRYHARVIIQDGKYLIEDTSAPGTSINQTVELRRGQKYELRENDLIEIGDCELRVESINLVSQSPSEYTSPKTIGKEITKLSYHQPTGNDAQDVSQNLFNIDDFFSGDSPENVQVQSEVVDSPVLANSTIDEAFNIGANQFDERASEGEANIDQIFEGAFATSQHSKGDSSNDAQQHGRTVIENPNMRQTIANDTLAMRAFLAELDIEPSQLIGQNKVEVMKVAGIVLRTLTEGMMGVLSARDLVKQQFGMDRTQVKHIKNNPLKFSTSPQEAMCKMLTQEEGYMDPIASAQEAVSDAKAHQVAMVSGLGATIKNAVSAFDPLQLENEFDVGFAFGKKAKYWELFKSKYDKIARETEVGSNDLFSEKFREYYEKQISEFN